MGLCQELKCGRRKYAGFLGLIGKRNGLIVIQVEGTKERGGRPKTTLIEIIKNYMSMKEITESITTDRIEWLKRIHVINPN